MEVFEHNEDFNKSNKSYYWVNVNGLYQKKRFYTRETIGDIRTVKLIPF